MIQIIINSLVLGLIYCLVALGITLIFSIMGVLNFAHGQMYMIGGFVIYYFYGRFNFNYFFSLLICVIILGVIGGISYQVFFRRTIHTVKHSDSIILLALGLSLILEEGALLLFKEKTRGVPPVVEGVFKIGNIYLVYQRIFMMIMALILILALLYLVHKTKLGIAMRALAQDKEGALLQGINVHTVSIIGFAIGSILAGLAGGLLTPTLAISSGVGAKMTLKSFTVMMLGGCGNVPGAIIGGFLLGFIEGIGNSYLPGAVVHLIIFSLLVLILIIRPQGIMGRPTG